MSGNYERRERVSANQALHERIAPTNSRPESRTFSTLAITRAICSIIAVDRPSSALEAFSAVLLSIATFQGDCSNGQLALQSTMCASLRSKTSRSLFANIVKVNGLDKRSTPVANLPSRMIASRV